LGLKLAKVLISNAKIIQILEFFVVRALALLLPRQLGDFNFEKTPDDYQ
jgi:hypothetical protein